MTSNFAIGTLTAVAGVAIVIFNGQGELHFNPAGDLIAVLSSASFGLYSFLLKPLSAKYDAATITRKVFGYGLLTAFPLFYFGLEIPFGQPAPHRGAGQLALPWPHRVVLLLLPLQRHR